MASNSDCSSSQSSSSSDGQKNPNRGSTSSIDQSLDAIENQLASISLFQAESENEPVPELEAEMSGGEFENGSANVIEVEDEEKTLNASSSRVWSNVSEVEEAGAPVSPSSSGYDGGQGSSATSSAEDEIVEARSHGTSVGALESQFPWTPGKRHSDEFRFSC